MRQVLLVSIGFAPNVGGIETHFNDLVAGLIERDWKVNVLTYQPLTTQVQAPYYESHPNLKIIRLPVLKGFFYKLVHNPILEFLYLVPGLFLALPVLLLTKYHQVEVIHSHGLVAGFVSVFWGKSFGKRVITTTHSIYSFPKKGVYRNFAKWIFATSDQVLTLSNQSKKEIEDLGVPAKRVVAFKYWIDLAKFKENSLAAKKLKWDKKYVILFVGRLIAEKGVREILQAASQWDKQITLAIAGIGPLSSEVISQTNSNIIYLGKVDQDNLPDCYSAAKATVVPSIHEEGFGRVILESLACGTPVIAANRGAIPEAMDESVGKLVDISVANLKQTVEFFFNNPEKLDTLARSARKYALKHYSQANINTIIDAYD